MILRETASGHRNGGAHSSHFDVALERTGHDVAKRKRSAVIQVECMEDLRYWVDTNRKVALRLLDLMEATMREPFGGIGKPEHLKYMGANVWSRRITAADRLVYEVFDDRIEFLQARYHY